ncbi:type I-E CRISPR-associated protein Cse1/CasA [Streptomyces luteireticuli]|uniref:Type I-E CRISPR-associated protein Cse1/CasA n=1 Tax=Streptomyces luteireticuli TaxID=173858 RepID=A0ABN0Z967_9ACTN
MPSGPARFNAADDPWIDVRTATTYRQVGLRDLFLDAHTIDDLALPSPPAASALLRILVAITARITDLDDADLGAAQWHTHRRQLLTCGRGFTAQRVHAYFDTHCFEVFDPVRPWLQDPALPEQCTTTAGINTLIFGRPAGNNLAWLCPHTHTDHDATPVPTAEALQHLLIHHYYGRSGGCSARTVAGTSHPRGTSGPLRSTVSFHPLGRTLHETLLAGIPPFLDDEQTLQDQCPWEETPPPDPLRPPHPVTWPGRLLTGRSRHAVLLIPGDDGTTVTDTYLTWATQHRKLETTDPYLIVHTDPKKPIERRRTVRRADADRAWWRDLDALLLAPDENRATRRPQVFDTLNDLPATIRRTLRVRVHGFDQDTKVNNRQWYTAITPPVLNWAQENDPQRAERIAQCCQAAEQIAVRLTFLADRAWKQTTTPNSASLAPDRPQRRTRGAWMSRARAVYWEHAERVFWRLLDEPDTPAYTAFADTAATALRQATDSDRVRHRAAARAVALAVAALYRRAPRPSARQEA